MRRLRVAGTRTQRGRLLGRVDVAVMVSVLALVAQAGLGLSPWVRTTFTYVQPLCSWITTAQICSTLTNISVFSIGPFIIAVSILSCISLCRYLGLLQILHGIIRGRNDAVRLWEFSPLTLLIIVLMPCSLSYVGWLFMYVQTKWTSNFLDPIQALHLLTSLVLGLQSTVVGVYFVGAFSLPAVLRNTIQLHQNHFKTHITTLTTLNFALISYCTSVLVLLGNEDNTAEKQEAVRMVFAEILYRVVCVIAASMLRNSCEVVLRNQVIVLPPVVNDLNFHEENALPPENDDPPVHTLYEEFENPPPPENNDPNPHEPDGFPAPVLHGTVTSIENDLPPADSDPSPHESLEPPTAVLHGANPCKLDESRASVMHGTIAGNESDPPPANNNPSLHESLKPPTAVLHPHESDDSPHDQSPAPPHLPFVLVPNYRMEGDQLLNRPSFSKPFLCPAGDTPRTVVGMEVNPKCGSNELVTIRKGYSYRQTGVHSLNCYSSSS